MASDPPDPVACCRHQTAVAPWRCDCDCHTQKAVADPPPALPGKCLKCSQTLLSLVLLAMIQDAGATVVPSATNCSAGGEHEF